MDVKLYHWYINHIKAKHPKLREEAHDILHNVWLVANRRGVKLGPDTFKYAEMHHQHKKLKQKKLGDNYAQVARNSHNSTVLEDVQIRDLAALLNEKDKQLFLELVDLEGSSDTREVLNKPKSSITLKIQQFRKKMLPYI